MDLQFSTISNNPLKILAISVTLSMSVSIILSDDPRFEACAPVYCGQGPSIRYPFWIPDSQKHYCGLPGFEVACDGENPTLNISGDGYIIKNISYDDNSLLLANSMLFDPENTCPVLLRNFSLPPSTPFLPGPDYTDLFLFYNCSSYPSETAYMDKAYCASYEDLLSFAVSDREGLENFTYFTGSCQSLVDVPVNFADMFYLYLDFPTVLRNGFNLRWRESNCSSCSRSGGRCGSADNAFVCFCSEKPHSRTCHDGCGSHKLQILNYIIKFFPQSITIVTPFPCLGLESTPFGFEIYKIPTVASQINCLR